MFTRALHSEGRSLLSLPRLRSISHPSTQLALLDVEKSGRSVQEHHRKIFERSRNRDLLLLGRALQDLRWNSTMFCISAQASKHTFNRHHVTTTQSRPIEESSLQLESCASEVQEARQTVSGDCRNQTNYSKVNLHGHRLHQRCPLFVEVVVLAVTTVFTSSAMQTFHEHANTHAHALARTKQTSQQRRTPTNTNATQHQRNNATTRQRDNATTTCNNN